MEENNETQNEYIRNYMRKYTANKTKVLCDVCGKSVVHYKLYKHKQSQRHKRALTDMEFQKMKDKLLEYEKILNLEQQQDE